MEKVLTHILAMMLGGGVAFLAFALCAASGRASRTEEELEHKEKNDDSV